MRKIGNVGGVVGMGNLWLVSGRCKRTLAGTRKSRVKEEDHPGPQMELMYAAGSTAILANKVPQAEANAGRCLRCWSGGAKDVDEAE